MLFGLFGKLDGVFYLPVRQAESKPIEFHSQLVQKQRLITKVQDRIYLSAFVKRKDVVENVTLRLGVDAVFQVGRSLASLLNEAGIEQVIHVRVLVQQRCVPGDELSGDAEFGS